MGREYGRLGGQGRLRGVSVRLVADPAQALADLTEISTQIEAAVVLDREGTVVGSTVDDERAGRLAGSALELFRAADEQREQELVQLDVALKGGSVFVVRDADRLITATTTEDPTVGLVFYDLKSCLRAVAETPEKPKAKPKPKPKAKQAPAKGTSTRTTTRKKKDESA
jgi:predicted regulator of Ras-like GTPase activity (Roadblock/LC7/MglB family)